MLYEAMKGLGEGVMIAVGLLIAYVLAMVLIDAARARRERRADEERAKRFRRFNGAVPLVLVLGLSLTSCSGDEVVGPSAAASPSPSPAPTPSPVPSECVLETVLITAAIDDPGRRNTPVPAWGLGQIALLTARPVNRFLDVIRSECPHFSLVVAAPWSARGAACFVIGPDQTSEIRLKCNQPGDVRVTATMYGSDDKGNRHTKTGSAEFRVVGGETAGRGLP